MKIQRFVNLALKCFLFFIAISCQPVQEMVRIDTQLGSLQLLVSQHENAMESSATIVSSRKVFSYDDRLEHYTVQGAGPGGASLESSWNVGESCLVDSLVPGQWDLTVTGYDDASNPVCSGSSSVTVIGGINVSATISLTFLEGTGSVQFSLIWPEDADIASGTVTLDSVQQDFIVDLAERTAEYTFSAIASGHNHSFSISLLTTEGDLAFGTSGTAYVSDGLLTLVDYSISQYLNPPSIPANLNGSSGSFVVELDWEDSDGETGFIIDRKEVSSSDWDSICYLDADTTSYRDIDAQSNKDYQYRVIAYNSKGESRSELFSVMTPDFSNDIKQYPVSFGYRNGYRILSDGRVMAYGANRDGQLGNDSDQVKPEGVVIPGLNEIVSIFTSVDLYTYIFAIDSMGGLWRWGYLNEGDDHVPVKITQIDRPVLDFTLSGGSFYALDADGNVWTWGSNSYGQLGDGTKVRIPSPVKNTTLQNISSIAAGGRHFIASSDSGEIYVCGNNRYGELGLGDTTERLDLELVAGITAVKSVRSYGNANTYISLLVLEDGSVMAAGYNGSNHVFGLPENTYSTFTSIPELSNIEEIFYNGGSVIALDQSGTLYSVGSSDIFEALASPTSVELLFSQSGKKYSRTSSGQSYSWGGNSFGELMTGEASLSFVPQSFSGATSFVQIDGGDNHFLAIDDEGDVWAWGENNAGQIGDSTQIDQASPVEVLDNLSPAIQVVALGVRSAALLADGSVYLWGGSYSSGSVPELVTEPVLPADIVEIAVGSSHYAVRTSDGCLWTWGSNSDGQLGNNSDTSSYYQVVQVLAPEGEGTFLNNVSKIVAASRFNSALLLDGRVVSWGNDILGNGTNNEEAWLPVYATGITTASNLFAGNEPVFAITDDDLWMWGQMYGVGRSSPVDFHRIYGPTISGITDMEINEGSYPNAMILLDDSSIRVRGDTDFGQLGIGTVESSSNLGWSNPIGPSNIIAIGIAEGTCIASSSDGTIWAWGKNDLGQFGNGSINPEYITSPQLLTW